MTWKDGQQVRVGGRGPYGVRGLVTDVRLHRRDKCPVTRVKVTHYGP